MVTVVCFQWNDGFRNYLPEHVNALARQVRRWNPDFKFLCITDEVDGFEVETMPLPESAREVADIPSPQGPSFPASYRRLWCFSDEATAIDDYILMMDIDALIVNDLSPLVDVDEEFVGYRPFVCWGREDRIAGGTWLLKTGSRTHVWETFIADPESAIAEVKQHGWKGSDQAFLSHHLYGCALWPKTCGIYQSQDGIRSWDKCKPGARILHFNGACKPWECRKPWIQTAYHAQ